ncbi:MAG TPA: hypothetical protein VGM18_04505 [Candidatus Sulfotelmatobacter sp.]|jgi:hypothetical protein
MNLDWTKAIAARLEGRTAVICASLVFCGFCLWLFVTHPLAAPWISTCLILLVLALAAGIALHTLLAKPKPSEPAAQFLLQQIGNQLVYMGGFHSPGDLVQILREAHNIQPLPPPSAVVLGSLTDTTQYKPLSPSEAMELQRQDEAEVQRLLISEADKIRESLQSAQLAGGQAEDPKNLAEKTESPTN